MNAIKVSFESKLCKKWSEVNYFKFDFWEFTSSMAHDNFLLKTIISIARNLRTKNYPKHKNSAFLQKSEQ